MKLYFEDSYGKERFIAGCANIDAAFSEISNFCKARNFVIPYIRYWEENGKTTFDVGSHTEFFHLYDKE